MLPGKEHVRGGRDAGRYQRQAGDQEGGAHFGDRAALDFPRRRNRLRHSLSFDYRKERKWHESLHWKYVDFIFSPIAQRAYNVLITGQDRARRTTEPDHRSRFSRAHQFHPAGLRVARRPRLPA